MKYIIYCFVFFFLAGQLTAQEFNCKVTINTPKLQTVDPKVFQTLKSAISDFMNNTAWTDVAYDNSEKIEVNFTINIKEEVNNSTFKADLAIQVVRPVYGSDYNSPLFSNLDKDFTFIYEEFQPLQYSKGVYNDNLSSMLSFYAYYILGADYDSFSSMGGETYFQTSQEILNNIPQSVANNFTGWRAADGAKTRYFLIENMLNPGMKAIRQGMYEYHRKGLDLMSTDPTAGRAGMQKALEYCDAVNKSYPNSSAIQLFAITKGDEIINVFKGGDASQRAKVTQIMSKLDAAGAQKYVQLAF